MKNQDKQKQNTDTSRNSPSNRDQTSSKATKEDPEQSGLTRGGDPESKPSAPAPKK